MIPRYSRVEMSRIWEPENRFKIWLDIELSALEARAELGLIPRDVVKAVRTKAKFNIERIDILEKDLKHDVIAFLTSVAEFVGPEARRLHYGMTSSDVLDTCLAVQLAQSADLLLKDIDRILSILKFRAYEFKHTLQIGRSHGMHAEPVTFGLKLALWHEEMKRNRERLIHAREQIAVGKISGAVGTFAHLDPAIEAHVCEKLKLKPAAVSSQIIQRDRHAYYFSVLAIVGATLDKIAVEIRHLQRTEVGEAEEFFSPGQKGSSAMPHKRNPVLSENISGLSRLLRGYASAAMENISLWHERDISHSSAERVIAPDAAIVLDFMLNRMCGLLEKLVVYPQNMKKNMERTRGLIFSQRVLLALTEKGCSREEAYRLVQKNAMKAAGGGATGVGPASGGGEGDFLSELKSDPAVTRYLPAEEIAPLFDPNYYLRHVDTIFKRVFG